MRVLHSEFAFSLHVRLLLVWLVMLLSGLMAKGYAGGFDDMQYAYGAGPEQSVWMWLSDIAEAVLLC